MTEINWKYQIGDRITKPVNKRGIPTDFVITGREIRKQRFNSTKDRRGYQDINIRYYEYKCNICGAEHLWKPEHKVNLGSCACCSGHIRVKGINTIGDLFSECLPYINMDDAFNPQFGLKGLYSAKCPICGNKKDIEIGNLLRRKNLRCDYCNSFAAKRPHLVKYLANQKDANLPFAKNVKVLTRCPDCGNEKYLQMNNLSMQGYKCLRCGDGTSFPEKFIISLLLQLKIPFIHQLSSNHLKWCKQYKYDFYLPDSATIIETHGIQHYEDTFSRCGGRNSKEEQENDKRKEALARKNGINNYIVLDCKKSNGEWIKSSILSSKLSEICEITMINWDECTAFALKGFVKPICELWNHNTETTKSIAEKFGINTSSVIKYLKQGASLGWCDYNPQKEAEKRLFPKKPISVSKGEKTLKTFESMADAARYIEQTYDTKIPVSGISRVCSGKLKTYKGFTFSFIS